MAMKGFVLFLVLSVFTSPVFSVELSLAKSENLLAPDPIPEDPVITITSVSDYVDMQDSWEVLFEVSHWQTNYAIRATTDRDDLLKVSDNRFDQTPFSVKGIAQNILEITDFPQTANVIIEVLKTDDSADQGTPIAKKAVPIKVFDSKLVNFTITPASAWFSTQRNNHSFSAQLQGFDEIGINWSVSNGDSYNIDQQGTVTYSGILGATHIIATPDHPYLAQKIAPQIALGYVGEIKEGVVDLSYIPESQYEADINPDVSPIPVRIIVSKDVHAEFRSGYTYLFKTISIHLTQITTDSRSGDYILSGTKPPLTDLYQSLYFDMQGDIDSVDIPRGETAAGSEQQGGGTGAPGLTIPVSGTVYCGNVHSAKIDMLLTPTVKIVINGGLEPVVRLGGQFTGTNTILQQMISSGSTHYECSIGKTLFEVPIPIMGGAAYLNYGTNVGFSIEVSSSTLRIPVVDPLELVYTFGGGAELYYQILSGESLIKPAGRRYLNAQKIISSPMNLPQEGADLTVKLKVEAYNGLSACVEKKCSLEVQIPGAEFYVELWGKGNGEFTKAEKMYTDDYISPQGGISSSAPFYLVKSVTLGGLANMLEVYGIPAGEISLPPVMELAPPPTELNRLIPNFASYENHSGDVIYAGDNLPHGYYNTLHLSARLVPGSDYNGIHSIDVMALNLDDPNASYTKVASVDDPKRTDIDAYFQPDVSMIGNYRFKLYINYKPDLGGILMDVFELPVATELGFDVEIRTPGNLTVNPVTIEESLAPGGTKTVSVMVKSQPVEGGLTVGKSGGNGSSIIWDNQDNVLLEADSGFVAFADIKLECPAAGGEYESELILNANGVDNYVSVKLHCDFIKVEPGFAWGSVKVGESALIQYKVTSLLTAGSVALSSSSLSFDANSLDPGASTMASATVPCTTEGYQRTYPAIDATFDTTTLTTDLGLGVYCTASSKSSGDPHLTTFDDLHYDFQASGEFILFERLEDGLMAQSRVGNDYPNGDVTYNKALAIGWNNLHLGFYSTGHEPFEGGRIVYNGTALTLDEMQSITLPINGVGDATLARELGPHYLLTLPNGQGSARLFIKERPQPHINTQFFIPYNSAYHYRGLMGNYNHDSSDDLKLRDNTILNDASYQNLYGCENQQPCFAYGDQGWLVTPQESIFDYPVGVSTQDYTLFDEGYIQPGGEVTLPAVGSPEYQELKDACVNQGVQQQSLLADCMYDFYVTGDSAAIDIYTDYVPPEPFQLAQDGEGNPIYPVNCKEYHDQYGIQTNGQYPIRSISDRPVHMAYCHFKVRNNGTVKSTTFTWYREKIGWKAPLPDTFTCRGTDQYTYFAARNRKEMEFGKAIAKEIGLDGLGSLGFFVRSLPWPKLHDPNDLMCVKQDGEPGRPMTQKIYKLKGCNNLVNLMTHYAYIDGKKRTASEEPTKPFWVWPEIDRPYPKPWRRDLPTGSPKPVLISYDPETLNVVGFDFLFEPISPVEYDQLCVNNSYYSPTWGPTSN